MLGDHIRALMGGRWLHGIDLGDQRVLFLEERPGLPPSDRLRRVYRPEFTAGSSRVETVVHRERAYPAKSVVARAWSRFMDPTALAAMTTSQQFAEWCKVGRIPAAPEAAAPAPSAPAPRPAAAPVAPSQPAPVAKVKAAPVGKAKAAPAPPPAKKGPPPRAKAKPAAKPAAKAAKPKAGPKPKAKPAPKKGASKKAAPKRAALKRPAARGKKARR
jgi:hypothetical protein